jgi:hypothetical protein
VDDSKKQKIMDELSATLGDKTARNGAGAKPRPEAKRPPPGVPDRTKKSVPEANLISLDEKASPSKGKLTIAIPLLCLDTQHPIFSIISRPTTPTTKASNSAIAA